MLTMPKLPIVIRNVHAIFGSTENGLFLGCAEKKPAPLLATPSAVSLDSPGWHHPRWPLDLPDRPRSANVRPAGQCEDSAHRSSIHVQCVFEYPKANQTSAHFECGPFLHQPMSSRSTIWHRLQEHIRVAKYVLFPVAPGWFPAHKSNFWPCMDYCKLMLYSTHTHIYINIL